MAVAFRSDAAANIGATRQTSLTVTKPAGTADGDVLIAIITTNNGTVVVTPPAGWTQVSNSPVNATDGATLAAFWKVASGEGADYAFTVGATTRSICGWIGAYTGGHQTSPVQSVTTTYTSAGSGTVVTCGSIDVNADGSYAIIGSGVSGGNGVTETTTHPSWTEEVEQFTATGVTESSQSVYDAAVDTGATGSQTITTATALGARAGLMLIVAPPGASWSPQMNAPETMRVVTSGSRW